MTSDILANAPLVVVGLSLDSPPAGPLPDIPAVGTGCRLVSIRSNRVHRSDSKVQPHLSFS